MSYAQDQDINQNMVPDVLEQSKLAMDQQKAAFEKIQKERELQVKSDIERQKLEMKRQEMQTKKEIEKMKADTALKIAKENKNKYDKK
jgi:hypothetical protein